MNYLANFNQT